MLFAVAYSGNKAIATLLLENEANLSARDEEHQTAMDIAVKFSSTQFLSVLMEKIEAGNNWGFSEEEVNGWDSFLSAPEDMDLYTSESSDSDTG